MSKWRKAAKVDINQPELVAALRKIPGVTVETSHEDFLIGRTINGVPHTFWIELKNPDTEVNKDGRLKAKALKKSQVDLLRSWTGHYSVCWTLEQILEEIGL